AVSQTLEWTPRFQPARMSLVLGGLLDRLLHSLLDDLLHRVSSTSVFEHLIARFGYCFLDGLPNGGCDGMQFLYQNLGGFVGVFFRHLRFVGIGRRDFLSASSPVRFKDVHKLLDDFRVSYDETNLAARIQLGGAQTLAADEGLTSIPDDGSRVQAKLGKFFDL